MNGQLWSSNEVDALKTLYPVLSKSELFKRFPHRSWWSIKRKAIRLKLRKLSTVGRCSNGRFVENHEAWNKNQPRPKETREKISKALTGKPSPMKGKKRPKSIKIKISEGKRRTWQNPDFRTKMQSHLDKIHELVKGRRKDVLIETLLVSAHDMLLDYVLKNPAQFGYKDTFLCQRSNFDIIGVTEDGAIERVEVELGAHQFTLHHDPEKCDRIIAYYNTKNLIGVPIKIVNKKRFIKFAKKMQRLRSRVEG